MSGPGLVQDPAGPIHGRPIRGVGWLFGVLAVLTIPWTVWLAIQLPSSKPAAHYDLAWAGFDAALVVVLLATAWSAVRITPWLPVLAGATGTMVLVDAWFDVVTAPTAEERWLAVGMAVVVEGPLASVCIWLAVTGQQLLRRRLLRRVWRQQRRAMRAGLVPAPSVVAGHDPEPEVVGEPETPAAPGPMVVEGPDLQHS
ncbi:hypothetical protein ACFUC1_06670 [Pedococcus sp. NPDC057267]|uniref:hypothetical protein n=1 Tax=Pedococcus sp. NPDC057267 TaxID=3346077 RepID=UPI00363CFFF0